MHSEPDSLTLDAPAARRLLLARAIDEVDTQGKLLSAVERDTLEREAADACRAPGGEPEPTAYLHARASRVLAAVDNRNPQLAAAQHPEGWRRWILWALPLAACVLGAALDRIDNPQQVNMLSPPLLGVLFWNLAAYLLLLVALLLRRRPQGAVAATLQRWLAGVPGEGRRTGRLRADVLGRFHLHWLRAAGTQQALWGKTLLHLTAAGWAVGLALSIVVGGLVRQYRVGWESTLLDLGQVHAFLAFLFAPVVALLPFEAFSAADLQRMAFSAGAAVGVEEARRWVWMYLALLGLVVVVPRLLLAGWAAARGRRLARAVQVDLRDPYFVEVLARVRPVRVTVGLAGAAAAVRQPLQRMLGQAADAPPPADGSPWTVMATAKGDTLRFFDLPPGAPLAAAAAAAPAARNWLQGVLRGGPALAPRPEAPRPSSAQADVVLLLASQPAEVEEGAALLRGLQRPALVLVPAASLAACEEALRVSGADARMLAVEQAAAHWLKDGNLLQAVAGQLAPRQQAGFQRLLAAWNARNERRFSDAMQVLARLLARAARESEEVGVAPGGLRQLVNPAEREAAQRAREGAAHAVLERLRVQEAAMLGELVRLHGMAPSPAPLATARHGDPFAFQRPLDVRQAGVAGAGSGAAVGAGIDLMVGGLTLGAAAALGAVIGGGAASVAAAWRNRSTAAGRPQLQLSDEMLLSLAESALLAYLAVADRTGVAAVEVPAAWRSEVVGAVAARRDALAASWLQARHALDEEAMAGVLAQELAGIARGLLGRL
ncbi:MAG: DUF3482 domain-containing protein [Ramlibacter sp.]